MNEFELTMRLRNNLIKRRRLELGLSPREAATQAGISYGIWLQYEGLKLSPKAAPGRWGKSEGWRPSALKIAEFIGVAPGELWPNAVLEVAHPVVVAEMDAVRLRAFAFAASDDPPAHALPPSDLYDDVELRDTVRRALLTLTPREERAVREYYFEGKTFRQIGESEPFGSISPSRAQQIIREALRKLRHPARAGLLKPFTQGETT